MPNHDHVMYRLCWTNPSHPTIMYRGYADDLDRAQRDFESMIHAVGTDIVSLWIERAHVVLADDHLDPGRLLYCGIGMIELEVDPDPIGVITGGHDWQEIQATGVPHV